MRFAPQTIPASGAAPSCAWPEVRCPRVFLRQAPRDKLGTSRASSPSGVVIWAGTETGLERLDLNGDLGLLALPCQHTQ